MPWKSIVSIPAATARILRMPAIKNHGSYGSWDFIDISDPWAAKKTIVRQFKAFVASSQGLAAKGLGTVPAAGPSCWRRTGNCSPSPASAMPSNPSAASCSRNDIDRS